MINIERALIIIIILLKKITPNIGIKTLTPLSRCSIVTKEKNNLAA